MWYNVGTTRTEYIDKTVSLFILAKMHAHMESTVCVVQFEWYQKGNAFFVHRPVLMHFFNALLEARATTQLNPYKPDRNGQACILLYLLLFRCLKLCASFFMQNCIKHFFLFDILKRNCHHKLDTVELINLTCTRVIVDCNDI